MSLPDESLAISDERDMRPSMDRLLSRRKVFRAQYNLVLLVRDFYRRL